MCFNRLARAMPKCEIVGLVTIIKTLNRKIGWLNIENGVSNIILTLNVVSFTEFSNNYTVNFFLQPV